MDALVPTEWLADELGASDLRIVDTTYVDAALRRDPMAEFAAGHIPGAVFLDLGELRDTANPLPNMLPSPEKVASRLAALGLGDGVRIVLYDASPWRTAARAWWVLRHHGVASAILDGGLAKWRAEDRPLETGDARPRSRHLTLRDASGGVRDLAAMRANLRSRAEQVLDARSAARFTGAETDPRAGVAAGHIPGSANLPYGQLFRADGTWKRDEDLAAAFRQAGVDLDRPVVTTCGSGVTAAVLLFGLHLLGRDGALYDGSWSEWGADPTTPKATATR